MGKFKLVGTPFDKKEKTMKPIGKSLSGSAILTKLQATNFIKTAFPCGYFSGKFKEF